MRLSVSSCRTIRLRGAPRALRIANSLLRAAERASSRFDRFTHTISRISPTAPQIVFGANAAIRHSPPSLASAVLPALSRKQIEGSLVPVVLFRKNHRHEPKFRLSCLGAIDTNDAEVLRHPRPQFVIHVASLLRIPPLCRPFQPSRVSPYRPANP